MILATSSFANLLQAISNSQSFNNRVTLAKHGPASLRFPRQQPFRVMVTVDRRTEEKYVRPHQSISHPQENAGLTDRIDHRPGTKCFPRIWRFAGAWEENAHPAHRGHFQREYFL